MSDNGKKDFSDRQYREQYEHTMLCPDCHEKMEYVFGERFICHKCGRIEMSDFGKVKEFIEENGPQPAIAINHATGVSLNYINKLLMQGRIEIPDGSEVYIKCQRCGTDIRYGRFCPECMMRMGNSINGVMSMEEVGERPKNVKKRNGEMHYLDKLDLDQKRVKR